MNKTEALRELVKVQCTDGNWNYSEYMLGMANGLICALAVVEDKDAKYLSQPDEWLCDKSPGLECIVSSENSGAPKDNVKSG